MTQVAETIRYTFAEYVAMEAASATKHEFLNGEIFAMAGGTPDHAELAANVITELRNQLRDRPCGVYTSDLRIRVLATGLATYPDASVVYGKRELDPEDKNTIVNPVVLVEVLSDSTEAYDRGEKFRHYRRIPSLREYVLVSQKERRIERYQRNEDGSWTLREAGPGETAQLASIDCNLAVDEVYRSPFLDQSGS